MIRAILLLSLTAGLVAGCAAASPTTTRPTVDSGAFHQRINDPLADVAAATRRALANLECTITSYRVSPTAGLITAFTPNRTRLAIELQQLTPGTTAITIRIVDTVEAESATKVFRAIRTEL